MTRYHNDLTWMLKSPELLELNSELSIRDLTHRMKVSNNFNYKATHRLGVYFEQLWQHLVYSCESLEVLEHNLQVIIDKHTLGEFDSIIKDKESQKNIHCELAVKFYLKVGEGRSLSDWVGPNLRDRFDNKYDRLFEHQLALSKNELIKQWLADRNINIDAIKLLTKGRLFYPLDDYMNDDFRYPCEVSTKHLKGFWTSWEDFAHLQLSSSIDWYLLPKRYWLSKIAPEEVEELRPLDNKAILIHGHNERYMFQRIQQVVGVRSGTEIMRGFVVTSEWLQKAKARIKTPS
ncbi:hypothetical protein GCM10009123_17340 [Kangiella japonica]|uniref:DUF1853 family protein n=2 Tax=Kangiella japonica TaxID=647384 RepID=A0ABN0T2U3_9GAMM